MSHRHESGEAPSSPRRLPWLSLAAALAGPASAQDEAPQAITIITPDYSSQPAVKEAIDLFIAETEGRGYDVSLTDTIGDNAAINGEITTAVAQNVDAIVSRLRNAPGVRRGPCQRR